MHVSLFAIIHLLPLSTIHRHHSEKEDEDSTHTHTHAHTHTHTPSHTYLCHTHLSHFMLADTHTLLSSSCWLTHTCHTHTHTQCILSPSLTHTVYHCEFSLAELVHCHWLYLCTSYPLLSVPACVCLSVCLSQCLSHSCVTVYPVTSCLSQCILSLHVG